MLKTLLKCRFAAFVASFMGLSSKRRKRKAAVSAGRAALVALLMVYLLACFGFLFFTFFASTAEPFHQVGVDWLYFTLFGLISFAMMFVFSVFTAKTQLFEAKDNDLLLSLPIPPGKILLSRMLSLLALNLFFELMVAVPAALAWCLQCPVTAAGAVAFLVECLCLPLFSLALSSLFGWLLSLLTARMRRKSLVSTVLSLAFLAAYFYAYSKAALIVNRLLEYSLVVADALRGVQPLYWLGAAPAEGNWLYLLLTVLCLIVPFLLAYWLLERTFIKTATTNRGAAKIKYREREQKVSSAPAALRRREMSRFLSSSTYIMNAGLGAVMLVVAAAALVIKRQAVLDFMGLLPGLEELIFPLGLLLLCAMTGIITISSASVSLEGKSLWIAQSLPVSPAQVLRAKLSVHLTVAVPAVLLAQAALILVFRPTGVLLLCAVLLPQVFNLYIALTGLVANLKHVNLNWMNESQAVKSGVAVLLAMLAGFLAVAVPAVLGWLFLRWELSLDLLALGYTLLLALVSFLLYRWVLSRGAAIFARL